VPGSNRLVHELLDSDLVDQVNLMIFPVVLGTGRRVFGETSDKRPMRLKESRAVGDDGVVVMIYERALTRSAPGRAPDARFRLAKQACSDREPRRLVVVRSGRARDAGGDARLSGRCGSSEAVRIDSTAPSGDASSGTGLEPGTPRFSGAAGDYVSREKVCKCAKFATVGGRCRFPAISGRFGRVRAT
jgi:RibD C-terminal domain